MTIDLADIFFVVNPGTVASLFGVGVVFGALFLRDRRRQGAYGFAIWLVGIAFAATMATTRYVQSSPSWEGWIGFGLLWGCYAIGIGVGSILGTRVFRHQLRDHNPEA